MNKYANEFRGKNDLLLTNSKHKDLARIRKRGTQMIRSGFWEYQILRPETIDVKKTSVRTPDASGHRNV